MYLGFLNGCFSTFFLFKFVSGEMILGSIHAHVWRVIKSLILTKIRALFLPYVHNVVIELCSVTNKENFVFFFFFWCTLISRAKFEGQPWSILFLGYWRVWNKKHFLPKIPAGEQIGFQTTRCKSSFFWNLYLGSLIWKTTFWKSWFSCPRSSILRKDSSICLGGLRSF